MDSNNKEHMDIVPVGSERSTADEAHILAEKETRLRERSREYRRRYIERQKEKDTGMQQRVDEKEKELRQAQLEQSDLISQSNALLSLAAYSSYMIEALSATAATSTAKARSFSDKAKESANSIQNWARHQWVMMPTAAELIAGTAWTPSDDHLRWFVRVLNCEHILANNATFLDRLTRIIEEGKASPEAQKHAEMQINYSITNARRFSILLYKERPELLEELVCVHHLKALRELAAAGKYAGPQILQNGPGQLTECVELGAQQIEKVEELWTEFVRDIKAARAFLGKYTSKVAGEVEAVMETGVYTPASSVQAAQNFLLATDAANASEEFLLKEGQSFIKLYIGAIQVLTPMQMAIVSTTCCPIVPHLPAICDMLLSSNNNSQPSTKTENYLIRDERNTQYI